MSELDSQKNRHEERQHYIRIGVTAFLTVVCCILFFFFLWRFQGFADILNKIISTGQPIIFGLVLAYLLNPIMKFFESRFYKLLEPRMKEKRKAKRLARGIGVSFAVLFLLLIIGLLIAAIVPSLVNSIMSLSETIQGSIGSFSIWLEDIFHGENELTEIIEAVVTNITTSLETWFTDTLLPGAQGYLSQITSGMISFVRSVLNFIIGIIVAVYVLTIKETLVGQSKKIIYAVFKPKRGNLIMETLRKTDEIFGGFIMGKLLDSAIIGVLCYIGCLILRMPNSMLIAVIIGVTNVIPFFGPIIGAVPCVLFVLIQSPIHALYLIIFILVLQQVDGNIIGPKILGNSTGLSSFWVMFAILIAGGMWGFLGMLLGVPSFAVIYYLLRKVVAYGLRKRNLPSSTVDYIYVKKVNEETNELIYEEKEADKETEESPTDALKENKEDK